MNPNNHKEPPASLPVPLEHTLAGLKVASQRPKGLACDGTACA